MSVGDDIPAQPPVFFYCTQHEKRAYRSRKLARAGARTMYEPGMREYPCTRHRGFWHNGHTPPFVMRGELTRDEFYALPKAVQRFFWMIEAEYGPMGDAGGRRPRVSAQVPAAARPLAVGDGRDDGDDAGGGVALPQWPLGDVPGPYGGPDRDSAGPAVEDRDRAA